MISFCSESGYKIVSHLSNATSCSLLKQVASDTLLPLEVFKDDSKCYVAKYTSEVVPDIFIIKKPRARCKRYWERFLTLFRPGESFRQFSNLKKLQALGFKGPAPLLAAEKRRWGMVVDSLLISTYINGRLATSTDVDVVAPELINLLNLGFTRKDPHPQNFIIAPDGVYFIDFHIKKPFFFNKLRCCMEYCKFLETVPSGLRYIDCLTRSNTLYSLANFLQRYLSSYRRLRRRISKRLK
ncbi:MAG: hypothetical protein R6V22_04850 [Rhodohalobacter sp.]|uniref:hypothetical protein n=1 Tax=Rhodohalobacter sp. TaxID=1974210 RepID=UPI0039767C06